MPQTILFGYEGGLVDQAGARLRVLTGVLAEEGVELSPSALETRPFRPPYEEWIAARMIHRARGEVAKSLPARIMARAAARYRDSVRSEGPDWVPGAVDFVERAAAAGYDLGVVATVPRRELEDAVRRVALEEAFRVVVSGEDTESIGAASSPYLVAMVRLNTEPPLPERLIHPHEVIAIEGTADRVRVASESGLFTVAVGGDPEARAAANFWAEAFSGLEIAKLRTG